MSQDPRIERLLHALESLKREEGASQEVLRRLQTHTEGDERRFTATEEQINGFRGRLEERLDRLEALLLQARVATADMTGRFLNLQTPPAIAVNVLPPAPTARARSSWPPWLEWAVSRQRKKVAAMVVAAAFGWLVRHLLPDIIAALHG